MGLGRGWVGGWVGIGIGLGLGLGWRWIRIGFLKKSNIGDWGGFEMVQVDFQDFSWTENYKIGPSVAISKYSSSL